MSDSHLFALQVSQRIAYFLLAQVAKSVIFAIEIGHLRGFDEMTNSKSHLITNLCCRSMVSGHLRFVAKMLSKMQIHCFEECVEQNYCFRAPHSWSELDSSLNGQAKSNLQGIFAIFLLQFALVAHLEAPNIRHRLS